MIKGMWRITGQTLGADYRRNIDERMLESIIAYINDGRPTGDCLRAIISNNLKESFGRADDYTQSSMSTILMLFYNEAPAGCWGREGAYDEWIQRHNSEDC